jgi:hypothetical protein
MFEDLKQQRLRGMSGKERARLVTLVSMALVLGAIVFANRSCERGEMKEPEVPATDVLSPPRRSVDREPLRPLVEAGAEAIEIDRAALDHLLFTVRSAPIDLAARRRTPAEVNALVPAEAAGVPVEVEGTLRTLDAESHSSEKSPSVDLLWAFALEGEDGARVVVLHGGSANLPGRGAPVDAHRVGGVAVEPLREGDRVVARGVYLQRKTGGTVGAIEVGRPTAVIVGSEFRRLPEGPRKPPPATLDEIAWGSVADRFLKNSQPIERDVHFATLAWAQAKGREAIAEDLRSGAIPTRPYDRNAYLRWQEDLDKDTSKDLPDQRRWTNEARGKVFTLTGRIATIDEESWATVGPNAYGVDSRWNLWIVSDHHHSFSTLRLHVPFPPTAFPGITGRKDQRVSIQAVFLQNYTYIRDLPPGSTQRPEVTIPYFVALRMEPWTFERAGRWNSVFWYAGLALLALGVLFYVVLIRGERKESAAIESHRIALRKRQRAHAGGLRPPAPEAPREGEGPAGPGT